MCFVTEHNVVSRSPCDAQENNSITNATRHPHAVQIEKYNIQIERLNVKFSGVFLLHPGTRTVNSFDCHFRGLKIYQMRRDILFKCEDFLQKQKS